VIARAVSVFAFALSICAACGGQDAPSGLDEPMRVQSGQFISGELPGSPPGTAGTSGPDDLRVTSIVYSNRIVLPGQAGKKLSGRASNRASAVGLRLADLGSGYWVVPIGAPDPQFPGELTWEADTDFALAASAFAGFHALRVVAIDAAGVAGEQNEVNMCLASREPDNLNACNPNTPPPDVVVSLFWDAAVDLDLRAVLPGGISVDPKHPLSDPTADGGAQSPDVAFITRDSLAGCVDDGLRQEDLVWQKRPTGTVDLYVQLANACGRPSTNFTYVVFEAEGDVPNRHLVEHFRVSGRIVNPLSDNESNVPPLYVASYSF